MSSMGTGALELIRRGTRGGVIGAVELDEKLYVAERFDLVELFGERDARMVGIENAFRTAVEDAIAQPPIDDPDHAPDARFGAVPPAQACRYRDLVENGAPFVRADVCGQSLAGFVHDTRLRARGSVLAGRVRRGL